MTQALYQAADEYVTALRQMPRKHRASVSRILKLLGVSRSGYYAWKKHVPSDAEKRKERIKERIRDIYQESHQNYGAPKITRKLRSEGEHISEKTVGSYMRQMGLKAQWARHFTHTTIDPDFSARLANILDEQFNPGGPDTVWVSDITYIWTEEDGFVYLTSIMDLYSRKIIAWTLSRTLEAAHVAETVEKAKLLRKPSGRLLFHSDRGCQYVSAAFLAATEGMVNSYSKKAYPWDNACIESFHALIKREWLDRYRIKDYGEAYRLVFEYIEAFYNTVRLHSHCGYQSPEQYEAGCRRNRGNAVNGGG